MYNVCHAYRPAHYLNISSLPWKAGWVGAVSTSPSLRTNPGSSVRTKHGSSTPCPVATHFPNTTILIPVLATIFTHTQMEAQTRGPWLVPPKLVGRRGLHIPHRKEARSFLVQEVKNSHLGGESETKHHHTKWPLIPTFKHFITCLHNSSTINHLSHHLFPT